MNTADIDVSRIVPGENVRQTIDKKKLEDLAGSITALGMLEPLVVTRGPNDTLLLDAGYRRLLALKALKMKTIPATWVHIIDPSKHAESSRTVRNIAENTARENVPPFELATGLRKMVLGEFDKEGKCIKAPTHTREEAARVLGMSKSHVGNLIRCVDKCSPVVLAAWKKDPDNIPTARLISWSALDQEEQEKELVAYTGSGHAQNRAEAQAKKGGGQHARAGRTKAEILEKIETLRSNDRGRMALEWAVGVTRKFGR